MLNYYLELAYLETLVLSDYSEYAKLVADSYEKLPKFQKDEQWRWIKLGKHVEKLFDRMIKTDPKQKKKMEVEFGPEDAYDGDYESMIKAISGKKFKVYTGFNEHPIFTPEQNLKFRAVHDFYAHYQNKADFSMKGEVRAYNTHIKLAPPDTWPAIFTEVLGQASYFIVNGRFPVQKIAVMEGFDYKNIGAVDGYKIEKKKLIKV